MVLDEVAVIARPGAAARRGETPAVEAALAKHRRLVRIHAPDTLDGGDVLRAGRALWVGLTTRTTAGGAEQLRRLLEPLGYAVAMVTPRNCLHLKTAVSALPDGRLLLNPDLVDASAFDGLKHIAVDPSEPYAGNVLCVGDTVLCPASAQRTRARLEGEGYKTMAVDASELAKAEGGLTCCSLLLNASG